MNAAFAGTLFDGETLATHALLVEAADGRLRSHTEGIALDVALADVRISDRLASLPRFLYLPDGRTIGTADNDAIDSLLTGQERGRVVAAVHWLEARAQVAAAATLLLVATVTATVWWGLPVLAHQAAMATPASIEKQAGQTALLSINTLLAPTQLKPPAQARVNAQLDRLLKARPLPAKPELVFRSMGGKFPNAFALPGGFLVVSDELVGLANDEELAAVLAHEIGHWQLRHGLQGVLRNSAALLVVCTVTGDLSTLTTFAGTIPLVLLQRGYSREFEEAADAYALALLRDAGINAVHFASILKKLENTRPDKGPDFTYLSTHPSTDDRVRRINPGGQLPEPVVAPTAPPPVEASQQSAAMPILQPERSGAWRVDQLDAPPRALRQPPPLYPAEMAAANESGSVLVEFVIDKSGHVVNPRVIRSTHKEFEAPAIAAVSMWRFSAGRRRDQYVATLASQLIEFNLEPAPPTATSSKEDRPKL